MKKYILGIGKLEIISFVTGFVLLAYELIAARVMAPSIGSSTYVWTSVIGIIIAALSLGYVAGGKLADARNRASDVVWLCLLAALFVVISRVAHFGVLESIAASGSDPRIQAVMAATILFAPASFVLGAISPYLVKLKLTSLADSGQSVASLSATNSVGGIVGTFVTGFILFGYVGLQESLTIMVVLLVAISWLFVPKMYIAQRIAASALLLLFGSATTTQDVIAIDTPSSHYTIGTGQFNGRQATYLTTGPTGIQSAVYDNYPRELVFWYTNAIAQIAQETDPERILVLGGGAYTLPQYFADKYPDATIDAVEIDPALEEISKKYFRYTAPDSVTSIAQDARTYVEQTDESYDFIVVDVYGDTEIPASLMTEEFGRALDKIVTDNGVVAVNLVAGLSKNCRPIFAAADGLYRQHFENAIFSSSSKGGARGNYVMAYSRQPIDVEGYETLDPVSGKTYRDNFVPAERLFYNCVKG